MRADKRKSGIAGVGELRWGTHFGQFYQTAADRLEVLVPYLQAGLESDELCLWVTAESPVDAQIAWRQATPLLGPGRVNGQLTILTHQDWQRLTDHPGGGVAAMLDRAVRAGFDGLRLAFEVGANGAALAAPELEAIGQLNVLALVAYPRGAFNALSFMETAQKHRFALVREANRWRIIESSETRIVQEDLKRSEAKLQSLFNNMSEGFAYHRIVLDEAGKPCDYVFLEANSAFERLTGLTAQTIIGRRATQILPGLERDPVDWIGRYGQVALTGKPVQFEGYAEPLRRWFAVSAFSTHRGFFAAIFSDITERKQAEAALQRSNEDLAAANEELLTAQEELAARNEALRESQDALQKSQERLRLAQEAARVGAFDWDLETGRLSGTPEIETLYGLVPGTFGGPYERWLGLVHPEDRAQVAATLRRALGGGIAESEFRVLWPDGSVHWLAARGQVLTDHAGKPLRMVGVNLDITERKRAEEALRQSEERFKLSMGATQDGLWDWNAQTDEVYYSPSYYRILGEEPGGFPATLQAWKERVHPEDLDRTLQVNMDCVEGRTESFAVEYRMKARTGAWRWILGRGKCIARDPQGRAIRLIGTHVDITERKRAEEELKKLNRTLRALSNSNQALLRATDEAAFVREACQIIVRDCGHRMAWVGYARADEAKSVEPVAWAGAGADYVQTAQITWADTERGRGPSGTCIRTGNVYVCNNFATDPRFAPWREEARKRGYASSLSLPLLAEGQAFGALMIYSEQPAPFSAEEVRLLTELADDLAHGITLLRLRAEHARATQALAAAKQAAEAANQAKDHFLAVLSHELRTPLNPALMAATILEGSPQLPPDLREDVGIIRRNVELEARLIDDMLDLTRIARGKITLNRQRVDGRQVLDHALQTCQAEAVDKQLVVEVSVPDRPLYVEADPARLQQVFWNLLKNAIKFTPQHGHIRVTAAATDPGGLRVEVRDTGKGIEPEHLPHIFDAFEQGDATVTKRYGGLGLGLAICKGLVSLHAGSIAAASAGRDRGATFVVELPPPAGADAAAVRPLASSPAAWLGPARGGCRILLVEDHENTAAMTARLLRGFGHQVTVAGSVQSARETFAREPIDLVISDLGLPDGSGHELMRQLLAQRAVPAIALSGYGMDSDLAQSREAGFVEHLVKPINVRQLADAIDRAMSRARHRQ